MSFILDFLKVCFLFMYLCLCVHVCMYIGVPESESDPLELGL